MPNQPSPIAMIAGHAIVGVGTTVAVASLVKGQPTTAIAAGVAAIIAHEQLDAPVSQAIASLGLI
jgi:hypothetical protein